MAPDRRAHAGARLATLAVLSGALATGASLLALAFIASMGTPAAEPLRQARLASHGEGRTAAPLGRGVATKDAPGGLTERRVGDLVLVDIGPDVGSLDDELARQRAIAREHGQRVLVWVVIAECKPCAAVENALSSGDVQRALARARIVRLSGVDFLAELSRMGVPMDAFPAFLLVGPDGFPTDYVDGGEWDDDVPQNIAPVLKSFMEGTYRHRRAPWRGGIHDDETPI